MALSDFIAYVVTYEDGKSFAVMSQLGKDGAKVKADALYVEYYPWAHRNVPAVKSVEQRSR